MVKWIELDITVGVTPSLINNMIMVINDQPHHQMVKYTITKNKLKIKIEHGLELASGLECKLKNIMSEYEQSRRLKDH